MKLYLHYEGDDGDTVTMVTVVEPGTTTDQLSQVFLDAYKTKKAGVTKDQISFATDRSQLSQDCVIDQFVQDRSDVYVSIQSQPARPQEDKPQPSTSLANGTHTPDSSPEGTELLLKEAEVAYQNGEASTAAALCLQVLQEQPKNLEALNKLVDIYLNADRGKKALQYAKSAARVRDNLEQKFRIAECYLACRYGDKALSELLEYSEELQASGQVPADVRHNLQVALAQAYHLEQQRDMALAVIQDVLKESKEHLPALVEYARLTWDLGPSQASQVAIILINALIAWQDNKKIKEYLSEFCSRHNGLKFLEEAMSDAWKSVPSLVYIANTLRDGGGVDEAGEVMKRALSIDPTHVSALLNYVHMLEVVDKHTEGFQEIRQYLDFQATKTLHGVLLDNLYTCIANIEGDVYLNDYQYPVDKVPKCGVDSAPYSEEDLYLLALLFTLVKILFVKGALGPIRALKRLLDPLHRGRELHTTLIRNEAAYFGCISKLLHSSPHLTQPSEVDPFIYLIGDSHCISPAWRSIQYKGKAHTLHPVLSTGTKIWHLRRASVFYPKVNFENSIKQIPDGATTIFVFGEIDCREALPTCVEKCRYDSIEDGISAVADIYLDLLRRLQREHNWVIYVHPVPPVLDLTRPLVMAFNTYLEKKIRRASATHIRWLPILDQLVTSNKKKLLKRYHLDGTHLNPNYIHLLEAAMVDKS